MLRVTDFTGRGPACIRINGIVDIEVTIVEHGLLDWRWQISLSGKIMYTSILIDEGKAKRKKGAVKAAVRAIDKFAENIIQSNKRR